MKDFQKQFYIFMLAVLAGIAIGIGGCVFLSLDNKVAGALMFTVGLCAICIHELNLFTGRVGYLVNRPPSYCGELVVIWLGNLAGTFLAAAAMLGTRIGMISDKAVPMCEVKVDSDLPSLFLLGIFCGFLMYVAVDGYRLTKNPVIMFMGVATFILCGFEHCIADMFYFSIAQMWSGRAVVCILTVTVGNSVGGILIPLVKKMGGPANKK